MLVDYLEIKHGWNKKKRYVSGLDPMVVILCDQEHKTYF